MSKNYVLLCCKEKTKQLILVKCKEEFLRNNPVFKGMALTEDFLLLRISLYYLDIKYEDYLREQDAV